MLRNILTVAFYNLFQPIFDFAESAHGAKYARRISYFPARSRPVRHGRASTLSGPFWNREGAIHIFGTCSRSSRRVNAGRRYRFLHWVRVVLWPLPVLTLVRAWGATIRSTVPRGQATSVGVTVSQPSLRRLANKMQARQLRFKIRRSIDFPAAPRDAHRYTFAIPYWRTMN